MRSFFFNSPASPWRPESCGSSEETFGYGWPNFGERFFDVDFGWILVALSTFFQISGSEKSSRGIPEIFLWNFKFFFDLAKAVVLLGATLLVRVLVLSVYGKPENLKRNHFWNFEWRKIWILAKIWRKNMILARFLSLGTEILKIGLWKPLPEIWNRVLKNINPKP